MKKELQKIKLNDKIISIIQLVFCFLIALLPRVYVSLQTLPVRTISDEVAAMSAGAYFAGYDWSEVIQNAGYYGTGFFGLFFGVFKLTDNPVIIYRTVLVVCALVQASVVFIAYYLIKYIFKIDDAKFTCIVSVLSSYCVVSKTSVILNEHIMILLCWIYALGIALLIKYKNDLKKQWLAFGLCAITLMYGLTIHTRFIMVILATAIVWLIYYFLFHEKLFKIRFLPMGIVLYILSQKYIHYIQSKLWLVKNGESVRNGSINLSTSADLHLGSTYKALLNSIIGQMVTMNQIFLGIFFFAIAVGLIFLIRVLKEKYRPSKYIISDDDKIFVAIFLIFIICVCGTVVGVAISWLSGTANSIRYEVDPANCYAFKAFVYTRYAAPYIGPVILSGILLCKQKEELYYPSMILSTVVFVICTIYFYIFILPYIENNGSGIDYFCSWSTHGKFGEQITRNYYSISFAFVFFMLFIAWICLWKKKTLIYLSIVSILLPIHYVDLAMKRDIPMQQSRYAMVSETYELIKNINWDETDLPDIYVYDPENNLSYLYQFYLNRYKIISSYPETSDDETILISSRNFGEYTIDGLYRIKQNQEMNQYLYVGKDLVTKFLDSSLIEE